RPGRDFCTAGAGGADSAGGRRTSCVSNLQGGGARRGRAPIPPEFHRARALRTMQLPWGVNLMLTGGSADQAKPLTGAAPGVSLRLRERLVKAVMQQGFRAELARRSW